MNIRKTLVLIFLTSSMLAGVSARAQEKAVFGLYNSPKGFGLTMHSPVNGSSFDSFCLHADSFGFFSGRVSNPGVKFNYSRNFILKEIRDEDLRLQFFAGPGVSAAYVYDYETSRLFVLFGGDELQKNMGLAACMSCTAGTRLLFDDCRISLDLSFRSELGVHIRRDEVKSSMNLSWYIMGALETFYPELTIFYRF